MTSTPQKLPQAFNTNIVDLPLDRLLPSRAMFKGIETTRKYAQIKSSIQEIGLIEPVAITTADPKTGLHIILDGHLRVQVVRDLGIASITCLRAKDDEGYTYNKRVNRLATVQEHYMILRALERGVPEERLARVLDINMVSLHRKRNLLEGICPEVVDLLKDQHFGVDLMRHLRRMKPTRQIECTELMLSLGNFSSHYAAALLAATPGEQLIDPEKPKKFKGLAPAELARMEQEMLQVRGRFKAIEQSYGTDVLSMVLARGYIAKLIKNPTVSSYLQRHQPDFMNEFQSFVVATSFDDVSGASA